MSDPLEVVVEEARTCRSTSLPRASMRAKDGAGPLFSYHAMGWYAGRYLPAGTGPPAGQPGPRHAGRPAPDGTHVFPLCFGALDEADQATRFFKRQAHSC
jgi:hypothetical protein